MCGIAGVISWDDQYRVTRETLWRMSAAIAHRGPDGEGFYLNHEQEVTPDRPQCGFAFRRLAILDPEPRAMQPFTIGDKTIVFNGEIYNFRELRAELTKLRPEYEWRTTGDTEVLLLAYDVWGEKCLDRLNGMFAFVIWGERDKTLFMARDRMGQKPLYVARSVEPENAGGLAFASELPALLQVDWVDREISFHQVHSYLMFGYVEPGASIYGGVESLGPAEARVINGDDERDFTYFNAAGPLWEHVPPPADAAARHETRLRVTRAVQRQLVADVPLGCFLSGGIDSSVTAAVMRSVVPRDRPVLTFSIGFDDPRYDESEYAAAVAQHLGTQHHRFTVRPDAAADLPKLAAALGEPFGDSSLLPTHYLSRETRRHVKVALSGDGGDELFGGYDRYLAMQVAGGRGGVAGALRAFAATGAHGAIPGTHPKSRGARLKRFLSSIHLEPGERYRSYVGLMSPELAEELETRRGRRRPGEAGVPPFVVADPFVADFEALRRVSDSVRAAAALDRDTYLPGDLLTKVDRASMLHGLEVRSPFMDHELVEFAAGLTTDQLLKGGPKRMLREAFAADLPPWVFKRKKMGFAVPVGDWFRAELRPMLRDNLFASDSFARQHFNMKVVERLVDEHETQRVDHSQRLYALLMLELWWRNCR